jgi:hypothetical protein
MTHSADQRLLALVLGCVVLLCLPLVVQREVVNLSADEAAFHLPAIRQIGAGWPALDLSSDSLSATAPGYHYLLATLTLPVDHALPALRALNLGVSLAVLVVLWRALPGPAGWRVLVLLPLACSNFYVKSASYVVTDNAALLAVALVLVHLGRPAPGASLGLAAAAAAAVATRQSGVWLVAPLALRAWNLPAGNGRVQAGLTLLLPLGVLGVLVAAWGGLVPPQWQAETLGRGAARAPVAAYLLAVAALLVPPYLLALRPESVRRLLSLPAALGGLAGLLAAAAAANVPDTAAGRWGGYLWNLAGVLPSVGDRSLLFLVLAPVGGAALALFAAEVWRSGSPARGPWLAALAGWTVSNLANQQVFHRYYEPTLLVLVVVGAGQLLREGAAPADRRPLAALAAAQFVVTIVTAHGRAFAFI